MEYKLDELKLKTAPELNDREREFIKQNADQLTDEDKEAYAEFLNTDTGTQKKEEGQNNSSQDAPENNEGQKSQESNTQAQTETTGNENKEQVFTFKSEDEARQWVKKLTDEQQAEKQKAIDAAITPEQKKFVEENWKPKDWNEGIGKIVETVKAELKAEADKKAEKEAFEYWDNQWKELSKEKNLRPLTDPEGRKVHGQIVSLIRGYGLDSFKSGYEMWEKIEAVKNGELPPPTPSEAGAALAKAKLEAQKKAAAKVGKAAPVEEKVVNTTGVKPFGSYEELHKTSSRGILRDL